METTKTRSAERFPGARGCAIGVVVLAQAAAAMAGAAPMLKVEAVAANPRGVADGPRAPAAELSITAEGAGPVGLGMTIAEVREALPGHRLARTTDGEGIAWVEAKRGTTVEMLLYAGEENADDPIDERARVQVIDVVGERYATAAGVHPGMPLREVEARYGKVARISMSEIESREYAEFPRQPAGLAFRVGTAGSGFAGTYPAGRRETTVYAPAAVVTQIEISGK